MDCPDAGNGYLQCPMAFSLRLLFRSFLVALALLLAHRLQGLGDAAISGGTLN